jgi:uncharacterized membrane-anchored protein
MLIAAEKGASLIVSVGSHFNLVEFLDKNRAACPRRSSRGCASARSSSTPRG